MNAEVVTVCSRVPTEPYYHLDLFLKSLQRFGEDPTILGMDEQWRGLMTKPYLLREWLRAGKNKSDRLIVCDAFDIIFVKHPHGIGDDCERLFGDAVVFNGEKGCWPRADLQPIFDNTPYNENSSPWRYLNSGFMCGPADRILEVLESMEIEKIGFDPPGGPYPNDQGEYQQIFADQPCMPGQEVPFAGRVVFPSLRVDTQCELAQTGSACELDEFDLSGPMVVNRLTGTVPAVWHFNGDSKNKLLPIMAEKWGL